MTDDEKIIQKIVDYCRNGNIWAVKAILVKIPASRHAALLNQVDQFGDTALVGASFGGHAHLMQYLLTIPGIDPNVPTMKTHFTPLIIAAANGSKRLVELLLQHSFINKHAKSINGMSADEEAIYADHMEIAAIIRSSK